MTFSIGGTVPVVQREFPKPYITPPSTTTTNISTSLDVFTTRPLELQMLGFWESTRQRGWRGWHSTRNQLILVHGRTIGKKGELFWFIPCSRTVVYGYRSRK
jgi:hypothetical protein